MAYIICMNSCVATNLIAFIRMTHYTYMYDFSYDDTLLVGVIREEAEVKCGSDKKL